MSQQVRSLFTFSFVLLCMANFVSFSSFNLLMPVVPLYLVEELRLDPAFAGIIIALLAICALVSRPFSGYLADALPRKTLFVCGGLLYGLSFAGYLLFTNSFALMAVRSAQGLSFGLFTTAGATLALDVIPEERMGTGISLYTGISAISMVLGPAMGMIILDYWGYRMVFFTAFFLACLCPLLGFGIKGRPQIHKPQPFTLNNLFLRQGARPALTYTLAVCIYGLLMNYFPLYVLEQGLTCNPGIFLGVMGAGLVTIRVFAGGMLDRGNMLVPVVCAKLTMFAAVIIFLLFHHNIALFTAAFLFGMGYGVLMPAYQILFVRIAGPHERGTANSTFFTALDGGIGVSIIWGGMVAQQGGYAFMYSLGAILTALSALLFALIVWPKVKQHCT